MQSAGCADKTRAMTQWPKYQEIERTNRVGGWSKAGELSQETLNRLDKVRQVAEKAADNINKGKLFTSTEYGVKVIKIYNHLSSLRANEVLGSYANAMAPLEMEIAGIAVELVKKLKDVAPKTGRVLTEEEERALKAKMGSLSARLTKLHIDLQDDLATHTQEPNSLATDRRTQEQSLKQLDAACRINVRAYTELLKAWEEQQYIKKDVSFEECCRWAGKLKALKHLDTKTAWLVQSLHKVASAVDALQANCEKVDFFEPVEDSKDQDEPDFSEIVALMAAMRGLRGISGVEIHTLKVPSPL